MARALSGTPTATSQKATTAASVDACVQGWAKAFHAEAAKAGIDDVVTMDQANEWTEWCKSGKQVPSTGD